MRLDPLLDSFYVLGSLWGGLPVPQVCSSAPPQPTREAVWASALKVVAGITAFVDVNVVPMDQERVLPHQTVLVEGGRITALGPTSHVKVPAGAVRIDGRGQYLMPGLADVHIHHASDVYPTADLKTKDQDRFRMVTQGITSIRLLAEGGGGASVDQMRAIRQHFQTAALPTPRPFISAAWPVSTPPESLARHVAAAKAAGYDHLGLFMDSNNSTYFDSLVAAARRVGLPISEHTHTLTYEQILAIGATGGSVEHAMGLLQALGYDLWLPTLKASGAPEISMAKVRELATTLRRAGVWVNPSLDCQHNGLAGKYIKVLPQVVRILHEGGVKFLLAADESTIQRELTAMVRLAGLSPYEALLTGTRHVAEYFRRLDDLGTVAVGKRADLVLLYGNPLADIKHIWEPAGVMVDGRWVDQATLDQSQPSSSWSWIASQVGAMGANRSWNYAFTSEQVPKIQAHRQTIRALTDSLTSVTPSAYAGVLQQLAAEYGALRMILTPEQQMIFDPLIRLGLRTEARKGHRVTVPGVAPVHVTS